MYNCIGCAYVSQQIKHQWFLLALQKNWTVKSFLLLLRKSPSIHFCAVKCLKQLYDTSLWSNDKLVEQKAVNMTELWFLVSFHFFLISLSLLEG